MVQIPTIQQLQATILADLQVQFNASIPSFGRVFLRAFAYVQAAKLKLFYLALANVQKNIFADTSDPEADGGTLERFGRVKLNRNPFPATQGNYVVSVTGNSGAIINAEQTFKSDDTAVNAGKMFVLDNSYTLTGSGDTITLRALEGGTSSKLSISDTLTATSPILGVNQVVSVQSESIAPTDAETIEQYRANILESYRLEPMGGASSDYRLWSKDATGVKQSYPFAWSGHAGEINVFVEAHISDSTDGKGTPTNTILTNVESVIEFDPDTTRPLEERGRRPLGVFDVHVLPITPLDIDISIAGYIDLTAQKTLLINNSIKTMLDNIRPYVAACDILENKNDILNANKVVLAILEAVPGSIFGAITINVNGSPSATYTFSNGDIPYLNTISYI